jgi:hypothetical protein
MRVGGGDEGQGSSWKPSETERPHCRQQRCCQLRKVFQELKDFAITSSQCSVAELLSSKITEKGVKVSFEPLLMCMVGGFITVNFSSYHHRFCSALEHAGPYIFLPFFTLVGASLDLITFAKAFPFAIIVCSVRLVCIFCGSAGSGFLLGESLRMNLTLWMTQIPQAGFTLGLAAQIGNQFDGWGKKFQAVIIS